MRNLRKFEFTYRRFFKSRQFEIEAFSLYDAYIKFYANFPRATVISVREVFE